MKHTELRSKFLKFFEDRGHAVISSDSLVPAGDPTLLFTSAGMNQFKGQFLGNIKGFTRAASCQKCLRTPDLDNVGKTAYHHTFFEMLGNFSFGDYFKEDAIAWGWEFMRETLKIPSDKLWASVYTEDDEAYKIWKDKIGLPKKRIIRLGQKDNFWPSEAKDKGPNGPCGPCSEIFYDYGEGVGCGERDCSPACSCGRFVEVWNLVFTQYDRKDGGVLDSLPSKNIDTGMGLERLCAVMQGVLNNFETDLFAPIIEAIKVELGLKDKPEKMKQTADIYALADHIRAATFAIYDGVIPSNEDRGYVIRNIIRKASLHARNLGAEEPVLYKLVYSVAKSMEGPYPDVKRAHNDICQVIADEEDRFSSTLKDASHIFNIAVKELEKEDIKTIPGDVAFKLFDTHGLPVVILEEMAAEKGYSVDKEGFEQLMEQQREQSRKKSKMQESVFVDAGIDAKSEFIGCDHYSSKATVLRILKARDGKYQRLDKADNSAGKVSIILDKSVFYPEAGGQIGDNGEIRGKGLFITVDNTRRLQDAILLEATVREGELSVGTLVDTFVNKEFRQHVAQNHTATHLLQAALRRVLGEHVRQQGSYVSNMYLRFDFTHFRQMTKDELARVEELVNGWIEDAHPVGISVMGLDEAKRSGALSFFGDKYDQEVKVVSIGDYSAELCGGTHLDNISQIGLFKIAKEGSVASGIRRIEAYTSDQASSYIEESKKASEQKEEALKKKEEQKQLAKKRVKEVEAGIGDIIDQAEDISGTRLIIERLEGGDAGALKRASDIIKAELKDKFLVFLATVGDEKMSLLLVVSDDLVNKGLHAGRLISSIAESAGGSGGGRPGMAQGGVKDIGKADLLMREAKTILSKGIK